MTPWATPEQAAAVWKACVKDVPADVLPLLLTAATEACAVYAPAWPADTPVPYRYTLATIYQAREVWTASTRDGDLIAAAPDALAQRARDLTVTVRQLLRPRRGIPGIG